jgi:hypothetical protein
MRPSLMSSSLMTSSNMSWWILFGWGLCKVADPFSASSVGSDPWLLIGSDPGSLVGIGPGIADWLADSCPVCCPVVDGFHHGPSGA